MYKLPSTTVRVLVHFSSHMRNSESLDDFALDFAAILRDIRKDCSCFGLETTLYLREMWTTSETPKEMAYKIDNFVRGRSIPNSDEWINSLAWSWVHMSDFHKRHSASRKQTCAWHNWPRHCRVDS
jgi:hypothetical protein